jgi:hypothetical protein
VQRCGGIDGLTAAARRLELDLLNSTHGGFVKAMPKALLHAHNLNTSRCRKYHSNHNLALDLQPPRFGRVHRVGLGGDHYRLECGSRRLRFRLRRGLGHRLRVRKTAGVNLAIAGRSIACSRAGNPAVAKSRARHQHLRALGAAGPVAGARTLRAVERSNVRNVPMVAAFGLTWQSVGTAEPSGLDLCSGKLERGNCWATVERTNVRLRLPFREIWLDVRGRRRREAWGTRLDFCRHWMNYVRENRRRCTGWNRLRKSLDYCRLDLMRRRPLHGLRGSGRSYDLFVNRGRSWRCQQRDVPIPIRFFPFAQRGREREQP